MAQAIRRSCEHAEQARLAIQLCAVHLASRCCQWDTSNERTSESVFQPVQALGLLVCAFRRARSQNPATTWDNT
ncbi:hypothetical protein CCHR01_12365 [Colletotrichum chrysophilum]|uniref:Uncharacterized protein n=1 Tax=Colletotrichum chrysophilum TaxID=1836956 RepID=A0AAD9AE96_9PEZI|nr:hypothetical protein CCHR01_12365 [Colletotrichum chrysophilum]